MLIKRCSRNEEIDNHTMFCTVKRRKVHIAKCLHILDPVHPSLINAQDRFKMVIIVVFNVMLK